LRKIYDEHAWRIPQSWFARAKLAKGKRDCKLNFFGVDASQPLSEWKRKGSIHSDDLRGSFRWYCRPEK